MNKVLTLLLPLFTVAFVSAFGQERPRPDFMLENGGVRVLWQRSEQEWKISKVQVRSDGGWMEMDAPCGEYTLLYSTDSPSRAPASVIRTSTGIDFPEPVYHYLQKIWQEATGPVPMNTAGRAFHFFPGKAVHSGEKALHFEGETSVARVISEWQPDPLYPGDIVVRQTLVATATGYFSLASPALITVEDRNMAWATVPGYFQGDEVQHDFVSAYAYGQGVPDKPVIYRERCASTLCPIVSTKKGLSIGVIPGPGLGRDPWEKDANTHQEWRLGLSHRDRRGRLSPVIFYPVLGGPASYLRAGDSLCYTFRYSLSGGDWYGLERHAIEDIYRFRDSLTLRRNRQSLTRRMERMERYLSDPPTAMWHVEDYQGMKIGAQSYLGGVVGSDRDAMKNSDYGAMWMVAAISGNHWFRDSILPYARNFKLAQQQTSPGFFKGAAVGQYYLAKKKQFVEEWGAFVEPVSLTYYTLLDLGNILLFQPGDRVLRERLRLGAELLLRWQRPDGSWELAYDRETQQPLFRDLGDYRPTFYGLLVAYRILGDKRYLNAARRGAEWLIGHAVQKGCFTGVCGDSRYAPDFATAQIAQALLDLYELTGEEDYKQAAIRTGRIYVSSIYTQPIASRQWKIVKGVARQDWEISQSGLNFEHGGIIGSANVNGPILLCSHAGLFVRLFGLTHDSLFLEMARAAAIGRDAFVDSATSVASYYWNAMNKGAGPYPHHAWWQIGWITDYLLAEAQLRSGGKIVFPRGFITPKVGPHESYGFAAGRIYGKPARLIAREGLAEADNPNVETITALSEDRRKMFIILLNDVGSEERTRLQLGIPGVAGLLKILSPYGIDVVTVDMPKASKK